MPRGGGEYVSVSWFYLLYIQVFKEFSYQVGVGLGEAVVGALAGAMHGIDAGGADDAGGIGGYDARGGDDMDASLCLLDKLL